MWGKRPTPKTKVRNFRCMGVTFCSVVVLILLKQSLFFGDGNKRIIVVSNDIRFKLKRSRESHVHERRELRLTLRKNQSYTIGESIDQLIVTKLLGNRIAEQKQNIKMVFVIHVPRKIIQAGVCFAALHIALSAGLVFVVLAVRFAGCQNFLRTS